MPRAQVRLSDAIDEYLSSRRSNGYSNNTVKSAHNVLTKLLVQVGNIYVDSIGSHHIDGLYAANASRWKSPETLNLSRSHLAGFFKWCRAHRYMTPDNEPLVDRRRRHVPRQDRLRVPVAEFPRLLDAAQFPRNRMIISLGLYLFLRAGEIRTLRVSDVHLDLGEVTVKVHKKGGDIDRMPVSRQLDQELRRWLTDYTERVGPLAPDMFLVPGMNNAPGFYDYEKKQIQGRSHTEGLLVPSRPVSEPQDVVHRALEALGYKTLREGCHTLRRSGARALYDELADRGHDYALEVVSAMLHHSQMATTQIYLGLADSERRRDLTLKGRDMFVVNEQNVTPLKAVEA